MLSAYSDTKLVMKGINHGACDYLLKPVRMEELKNTWQHVIRRKKVDPKDQNRSPHEFEKSYRKRKDQDGDEEDGDEDEDGDDDGHENQNLTTQKKPRVVWTPELHRKFVGAVNQLGVDSKYSITMK